MSLFVIGVATVVAAIIIYRLSKLLTGPSLRLPPGPRPWPIVGNLLHMGPERHRVLGALAQTHGPLMLLRLGFVNVVVASSATVAEQFLKVHDANFSSRPTASVVVKYMSNNYQDFAFAPYGPRWRFLRKICAVHMFSVKAVDEFRHVRQEEVTRMISNLASSSSKAVNMAQLLNVCTTNALARVMIGRRVFNDGNDSCDPKADEFKSMVTELMELLNIFNISDFFPTLKRLDLQGVEVKAHTLHKKFDTFLSGILEEHKSSKSEKHQDLLSTLLSLKETSQDGQKLTDEEIKALLLNMFAAGTDTSSSTIEWAIAELIKNPRIMACLQQELDSVVGCDRLVTEMDLPHLPYLEAVVKETFRLHPSTPLSLPRIATESCEIFGYHIPKGATLLVNVWAISHDPKEWPDPFEFKPERFILGGEKANVDVKGNDFEVIPFGAGRRICAGLSLGLRVVQLLVASLTHAFDWELENGLNPSKLNMDEESRFTLQKAIPLSVYPRPRLSPIVYLSQ